MTRVLIGWEFGANRGHADRLVRLADRLRAAGHDPVFALQRIDAISSEQAGGAPVWQAPLSPRLLVTVAKPPLPPPAGMADILARLGLDDAALVAAVIGGWKRILDSVRPGLVVADFAPFLLLAARGRLPTVLLGTGFSAPPAEMAAFPSLTGQAGIDQDGLLGRVNEGLALAGRPPVAALPAVFSADLVFAETFSELDPYAGERRGALARPLPEGFDAVPGDGEEVFVYAPERLGADSPLWKGLARSGLAVRVHVPRALPAVRAAIEGGGMGFEPQPLPLPLIAQRSRLLLSHGGHGFVCAGLAAGLPHVVFHFDLEKHLHGRALARVGLGGHVALAEIQPEVFAASLRRVHADQALSARARAAGPGFLSRPQPDADSAILALASDC
jgi:rhamnosyltransferase subunit B